MGMWGATRRCSGLRDRETGEIRLDHRRGMEGGLGGRGERTLTEKGRETAREGRVRGEREGETEQRATWRGQRWRPGGEKQQKGEAET